jgi:hypothetical protein
MKFQSGEAASRQRAVSLEPVRDAVMGADASGIVPFSQPSGRRKCSRRNRLLVPALPRAVPQLQNKLMHAVKETWRQQN